MRRQTASRPAHSRSADHDQGQRRGARPAHAERRGRPGARDRQGRCADRHAPDRRRRGDRRPHQHARVLDARHDQQRALRPDAQPVGPEHFLPADRRAAPPPRSPPACAQSARATTSPVPSGSPRSTAALPAWSPTTPADSPLASVHGPLARCVGDIRLALAVMQPPGPRAGRFRVGGRAGGHAIGLIAEIPGMPIAPIGRPGAARRRRAALEAGRVRRRAGRRARHRRTRARWRCAS